MELLRSFFGGFCKPEDLPGCCGCKNEPEVLTKAWIDHMEQVSVLGESPVKVQQPQRGGSAPSAPPRGREPEPVTSLGPEPRAGPTLPVGPATQVGGSSSSLSMLKAPPEFDLLRGGLHSPASAGGDPGVAQRLAEEQRQTLQACVRAFTRALLRGISVSVLLDDGCTCLAEARMDSELTHLVLHVPHTQHPVSLRSIESVSPPEEAWLPQVGATRFGQLDICCATLLIEGGQFLTMVFDSPRTREYFEVCLKVLILARETSSPAQKQFPGLASVPRRSGDEGPPPKGDLSPDTGTIDSGEQSYFVPEPEPPPLPNESCAEETPTRV